MRFCNVNYTRFKCLDGAGVGGGGVVHGDGLPGRLALRLIGGGE